MSKLKALETRIHHMSSRQYKLERQVEQLTKVVDSLKGQVEALAKPCEHQYGASMRVVAGTTHHFAVCIKCGYEPQSEEVQWNGE